MAGLSVCLACDFYVPAAGGIETHVLHVAQQLKALGAKVRENLDSRYDSALCELTPMARARGMKNEREKKRRDRERKRKGSRDTKRVRARRTKRTRNRLYKAQRKAK